MAAKELLCRLLGTAAIWQRCCPRKIEMSPGAQRRDDTSDGEHTCAKRHHSETRGRVKRAAQRRSWPRHRSPSANAAESMSSVINRTTRSLMNSAPRFCIK